MTKPKSHEQPRIIIDDVSDTFKIFQTNFALTSTAGCQLSRNEPPEDRECSLLALEVVQIPGVETVVVRCYGLGVHRAPAFDWEPIVAEVQMLLCWVAAAFDSYSPDPQVQGAAISSVTTPATPEPNFARRLL